MGFSTPSIGKAAGASPLNLASLGLPSGSPPAQASEPPRLTSLLSMGFRTPSIGKAAGASPLNLAALVNYLGA